VVRQQDKPAHENKKGVILVTVCFTSRAAVSFIDFFTDNPDDENKVHEHKPYQKNQIQSLSCSHHLFGFSLAHDAINGDSTFSVLSGYDSLRDGQVVRVSDLPLDIAIVPTIDDDVGAIRYYLPSSEVMAISPFTLDGGWLHQMTGTVSLRADAFSTKQNQFLGSCVVTIEIDPSRDVTCGPGVTGLFFFDRKGVKVDAIGNLCQGQVIPKANLLSNTDLAVSYKNHPTQAETIKA
jgi:hypothetical protein